MPSQMEVIISQQLAEKKNTEQVGQILIATLSEKEFPNSEKKAAIQFLISTKNFKKAFQAFTLWLTKSETIPWAVFLQLIHISKQNLNSSTLNLIFDGATEQEQLYELTNFWGLDSKDKRFSNLRSQYLEELKQYHIQKRKDLLDRISYLKNNRMIEEEKKSIDNFALRFPGDESVPLLRDDFKVRWARHIISKNQSQFKKQAESSTRQSPLTPEEVKFSQSIVQSMHKKLKTHPQLATDFSICLFFMELYKPALELMEKIKTPSPSLQWLKIESLIKSEQFIEALEQIQEIEVTLANEPETPFSTVYLKAQCLWGLGQRSKAIELIKGLVNVRPQYRSAYSLLNEWSGATA